jgi:hypothetical protein
MAIQNGACQGPRIDAANESSKPRKAERGESKRPKVITRARFTSKQK